LMMGKKLICVHLHHNSTEIYVIKYWECLHTFNYVNLKIIEKWLDNKVMVIHRWEHNMNQSASMNKGKTHHCRESRRNKTKNKTAQSSLNDSNSHMHVNEPSTRMRTYHDIPTDSISSWEQVEVNVQIQPY
jgi:hypothetical protein